jgi:hypothetical protein
MKAPDHDVFHRLRQLAPYRVQHLSFDSGVVGEQPSE